MLTRCSKIYIGTGQSRQCLDYIEFSSLGQAQFCKVVPVFQNLYREWKAGTTSGLYRVFHLGTTKLLLCRPSIIFLCYSLYMNLHIGTIYCYFIVPICVFLYRDNFTKSISSEGLKTVWSRC